MARGFRLILVYFKWLRCTILFGRCEVVACRSLAEFRAPFLRGETERCKAVSGKSAKGTFSPEPRGSFSIKVGGVRSIL